MANKANLDRLHDAEDWLEAATETDISDLGREHMQWLDEQVVKLTGMLVATFPYLRGLADRGSRSARVILDAADRLVEG